MLYVVVQEPAPEPVGKKKGKGAVAGAKSKTPAKGNNKKGDKKAPAGKKGGKGSGKKETENADGPKDSAVVVEDLEAEPPMTRSKTMPERKPDKTELSMKDAEKVKVDVYIPDDKTKLPLKDTITVMNGKEMERAKTTLGVARPPSSRPVSAKSGKPENNETKGSKAKKGKKGGKEGKGGKEKKGKKKK